jgi:hypothetical protein
MDTRVLAPILYFAYKRPDHTLQTLEALSKSRLAEDSHLWIYIDGPKATATEQDINAINEVKKIVYQKQWCKTVTITEAEKNKGLFKAITEGIINIINQFGKVIIIEDDVLVSEGFLEYMNDALDLYRATPEVMHVSGYSLPQFNSLEIKESTYFFKHTSCWGWGTWKRAWDFFDADAKRLMVRAKEAKRIHELNMESTMEFYWGLKRIADGHFQDWNYNWHTSVFLQNGLCLHPTHSLVSNIGHDGTGTNCDDSDFFKTDRALAGKVIITPIPLVENKAIRDLHRSLTPVKSKMVLFLKHYARYLVK